MSLSLLYHVRVRQGVGRLRQVDRARQGLCLFPRSKGRLRVQGRQDQGEHGRFPKDPQGLPPEVRAFQLLVSWTTESGETLEWLTEITTRVLSGELLLDQQRFEDAVNQFSLAMAQESEK